MLRRKRVAEYSLLQREELILGMMVEVLYMNFVKCVPEHIGGKRVSRYGRHRYMSSR